MSANTISLTFKVDDVGGGLNKLVLDIGEFKKLAEASVTQAQKLTSELSRAATTTTVFTAVSDAIRQFNSAVSELSAAYSVQVQAETQLQTVMQQRMDATVEDVQAIKDLCTAQQELGVIGDEVQLAGAQQLATFVSQRSTLETLIPVMNDLAAQQAGLNATSADTTSAATLLGKAMSGNTTALQRMGVYLDDNQKRLIEHGTESERAAVLVDVITDKVGHMNAELAKTDAGKQKQMANTLGDIKEMIGGYAQSIAPIVNVLASITIAVSGTMKLIAAVKGTVVAVRSWGLIQKACNVALKLTGVTAQATAISTKSFGSAMGGVFSVLERGNTVIRATTLAMKGLQAVTVAGALFAVGATIYQMFSSAADDATESTNGLTEAQKRQQEQAQRSAELEKEATMAGASARIQIEQHIAAIKNFNGTKQQENKLLQELGNTYGETMGYFDSLSDWYKALTANSEAYCKQMILEAETCKMRDNIVSGRAEYKERAGGDFKGVKSVQFQNEQIKKAQGRIDLYQSQIDAYNEAIQIARRDGKYGEASNLVGKISRARDNKESWERTLKEHTVRRDMARDLVNSESDFLMKHNEISKMDFKVKGTAEPPRTTTTTPKPATNNDPVFKEDATTLKDISENIRYYQNQLENCTAKTAPEVKKQIAYWEGLKKEITDTAEATKEFNPDASTIAEYEDNIKLLTEQLRNAKTETEAAEINKQIAEQQKSADTLRNAGVETQEVKATPLVENATMLKDIEGNVRHYQELLQEATAESAGNINEQIEYWTKLGDAIRNAGTDVGETGEGMQKVGSAIQQVGSSIGSLGDALECPELNFVGVMAQAVATMVLAYAQASSKSADLGPFGWIAFSAAGLGVLATMISQCKAMGSFADGGIVSGPTLGLVGEYAGASHNPEVIAPLNKLKSLIEPRDAGMSGHVEFEIDGRKLRGVLQRVNNLSTRS